MKNKPLDKAAIRRVESTPLVLHRSVLLSFLGDGATTRAMDEEIFGLPKSVGFYSWAVYRYYGFNGEDQGAYSGDGGSLVELVNELLNSSLFPAMHSDRVTLEDHKDVDVKGLVERLNKRLVSDTTDRVSKNVGRVGQDLLRTILLEIYQHTCALCRTSIPSQLRASHIVPWRQSKKLRLDPSNAILLCRQHDGLFDEGLISLTDDYDLMLSAKLDLETSPALQNAVYGVKFHPPTSFLPKHDSLRRHRRDHGLT